MIYFDSKAKALSVGDDVVFVSSGYPVTGYIYKIDNGKVYMTRQPRDKRPFPDGHKRCDAEVTGSSGETIGYRSYYIIKL